MSQILPDEIRCATLVRAEPGSVYDAIATAERLDGWFTRGATVDARPGGEIHFRWRDWGPEHGDYDDDGRVLEARRPGRFVFQWHPDNRSYATKVEIDVEKVEGGTVIRLKESGFQDSPSGRKKLLENAAGWGEALALWKFYVEHGIRY